MADVLAKAMGRNLTSTEWGQFGKMINNFGFPIVMDCAEKFARAKMPIEEKNKCVIKYMWGILKKSRVSVEREEHPDIEDILGKERSI